MSRELCYFVEARLIVAPRPALVNESNRDRIGWLITLGAGLSAYGEDEADDSEDRSSSRLTNPAPRFFACSGWIRHLFTPVLANTPISMIAHSVLRGKHAQVWMCTRDRCKADSAGDLGQPEVCGSRASTAELNRSTPLVNERGPGPRAQLGRGVRLL